MKILTKQEEEAHYNATLKGGITGGLAGLVVGGAVVYGSHLRFPAFRSLTLPMKAFLTTSSATFAAIISADRSSRAFEVARDPQRQYRDKSSTDSAAAEANKSTLQKAKDWGRENRYPIVGASWVASMGISLALVGRNPYLTKAQKLVQARVYAQGLTLAILIATAALEVGDKNQGKGRWETIQVLDPNDPEHKHMIEKKIHHEAYAGEDLWRDMVETEERKMASQHHDDSHSSNKKSPSQQNNKREEEGEGTLASKENKDKAPQQHSKRQLEGERTPKGTENKNKIVSESKSAGKVDYKEAEKKEAKNMERQKEKERDAKEGAGVDVKISDR